MLCQLVTASNPAACLDTNLRLEVLLSLNSKSDCIFGKPMWKRVAIEATVVSESMRILLSSLLWYFRFYSYFHDFLVGIGMDGIPWRYYHVCLHTRTYICRLVKISMHVRVRAVRIHVHVFQSIALGLG